MDRFDLRWADARERVQSRRRDYDLDGADVDALARSARSAWCRKRTCATASRLVTLAPASAACRRPACSNASRWMAPGATWSR